ncbi:MAG: PilC/PilY family type IV pilus protein [Sideroxyarcus sp.]
MKRNLDNSLTARYILGFTLAATLALPLPSLAASVALATEPLSTTSASNVKPNVMFIFDDSGSMEYDFLPDWAGANHPVLTTNYTAIPELFKNNGFNGVAYNAAVTYSPPVHYNTNGSLNTTTYPNYTTWTSVKDDGFGILTTGTSNLVGNAQYYTFISGEYCSNIKKTSCVTSAAATTVAGVVYDKAGGLRWCNSAALTNCRSIWDSTYKFPRYPGQKLPARATITVTVRGSVNSVTVNGQQILSAATSWSASGTATTAVNIMNSINACTAAITGNCTVAGYSATRNNNVVTVYAPASAGAITYLPTVSGGTASTTRTAFAGYVGVPGSIVYTNVVSSTPTYAYPGTASKAPTRTDCSGTTCTYAEEMTNYANWWAYYHNRVQSMKTSVSRAFKTLDQNYRVGYSTICDKTATTGTSFLDNAIFELAHKNKWFTTLFNTGTGCWTPLRGALSKVGQYYAHKIGTVDPVQYSCQQNFAILSTDGYWNSNVETSTFGPYALDGALVGDLDYTAPTTYPSDGMYQGPSAASNTLADVAKYYYETDLRSSALGNCTGASSIDYPSGSTDVCFDNVFTTPTDSNDKQHMTTFTMGLGADGTLNFQTDYNTAMSGDYYDLINALGTPTTNWSNPITNSAEARIDDLWHAAVNGRGSYFSAKDPDQIIAGFNKALKEIGTTPGGAAAAATSTLNPVAGNNLLYLATYTTVKWTGNLQARSINTDDGSVSDSATWCAESISKDECLSPATIDTVTSGSSTVLNCVVPNATALTCTNAGSVFDAVAETCTTEIANVCTGTLPPRVATFTDTRTIYTAPAGGLTPLTGQNLVLFNSSYATANPASFSPSTATPAGPVDGLTQWSTIASAHSPVKLLSFLRGQTGYEMRSSNATGDKLYRVREAVMGDALESQPAYISNPVFNYTYSGYSDYKVAKAGRFGTVFVGSNDGMLHAFVAATDTSDPDEVGGRERWAYVPSMVIPNLWKLADTSYNTKHTNYINGSVNIADICVATDCTVATAADWRTILVGGLNGGGRGYYALDITDPEKPILLWEFTHTKANPDGDADLGYSFGNPVITRKTNGTWVIVFASGYNNSSGGIGNGKGYLYVLNAATGKIISKISTGVGDTTTPSGLAQIAVWNDAEGGNQAGYTYATDLLGNIWRFDINSSVAATGTGSIGNGAFMKFATLKDSGGAAQPITTTPVLGLVNTHKVVFVGTGKYLEAADKSTSQVQSLYAIKDVGASATWLDNPRSHTLSTPKMVQQVITMNGSTRFEDPDPATRKPVDFSSDLGWFIDFPDAGTGSERVNIDPKLILGTLLVPTIVPKSTACTPGGYGWFNYFDYSNGWPVGQSNDNVSVRFDSPIVGFNVIYVHGDPKILIEDSSGDINFPDKDGGSGFFDGSLSGGGQFKAQRSIWRELIP